MATVSGYTGVNMRVIFDEGNQLLETSKHSSLALAWNAPTWCHADGVVSWRRAKGQTGVHLELSTYLTECQEVGTAIFQECEFCQSVARGSVSKLVIQFGKLTIGNFDGRDSADMATIAVEDLSGSSTFPIFHALVRNEGPLHDADAAFLGDRVRIEGVPIHVRTITGAVHRSSDECCGPALENETLAAQGVGYDDGEFTHSHVTTPYPT